MTAIALDNTLTIGISVRDRHASAQWFTDMLGFQLAYHADDVGWSEVTTNIPGVIIGMSEHSPPVHGSCIPVFGTLDLDGARQALEAASVVFEGETEVIAGMVKTATFYDPDGNTWMLAEDLSGGA